MTMARLLPTLVQAANSQTDLNLSSLYRQAEKRVAAETVSRPWRRRMLLSLRG